jgi:hypothetical protein
MEWLVRREDLNFGRFYAVFSTIVLIGTFIAYGEQTEFERRVFDALLPSLDSDSIIAQLVVAAFRSIILSPPFLAIGAWETNYGLKVMQRQHYPEYFPPESPKEVYARGFAHHFLTVWTSIFIVRLIVRFYFANSPSVLEEETKRILLDLFGYSNGFLALLVSQLTIGSLVIAAIVAAYEQWNTRREDAAETLRLQTGETSYSYRLGRSLAKWWTRK